MTEVKTNTNIKINNIDFVIKRILLSEEYNNNVTNYSYFNNTFNTYQKTIKILTETSNQNYMKVSDWFDAQMSKPKKENLFFNSLKIYGMFPIDYDFSVNHMNVTFSADYYEGDINLFRIQQLRKEKLLKINQSI